jgi:hypothetical protein
MSPNLRWILLYASLTGLLAQAQHFAFAGVGLRSDLQQVAARYPRSVPLGQHLVLAPEDAHDGISTIEISGTGGGRRVRISFETRPDGREPDYPRCREVEEKVAQLYGRPHQIVRFNEESSRRVDRVWRSATEEMRLVCFKGARRLLAEAVLITTRR